MRTKRILLRSAALAAALAASGLAFGQATDSNSILLQLLVKKGLITRDEANQIQQEAAANAAANAAASANANAAPSAAPAPEGSKGPASSGSVPPGPPAGAVAEGSEGVSPLFFKIGAANFTPVGFLDFTGVYHSTNAGNAIGTSFNSIPYNNTTAGQISETKFSAQNSRLGLRVDSNVDGAKVLGYVETDFLGYDNTNASVSSNSMTMRLRVYFADVKLGPWEFMAGQDWSMLTPNRNGIGVMPSDVFYSLDMDTNYQAGLTWARQPQIRALYHATDELTLGLSLEDPDQYVGTAVTLPTGFTSTEVDTGSNGGNSIGSTAPNVMPDVIGKIAYDTKVSDLPFHLEVAGLLRDFKINTYTPNVVNANSSATGEGASVAANVQILPGLTLLGTGFVSQGGGRYINGLGPDFIVTPQANASSAYGIKTVSADSAILGLEWQAAPASMLFGYWSQADFGRYTAVQANGTRVGYGYTGSANSNNRSIGEYTLGEIQTIWKSPALGALQLITQASYVDRKPWYVATGSPSNAHAGMIFFDVRYVLP